MKRYSTLLLRAALIAMGAFILFLCVLFFPAFTHPDNKEFIPLVTGLYVAAVPFYYALFQAWQLLGLIDKNKAFSILSIKSLRHIKYSAIIITGLFAAYTPIFMERAQADDAPGIFAINLMIGFMSAVIALFSGVLQSLFQNAVDLKAENDLTV